MKKKTLKILNLLVYPIGAVIVIALIWQAIYLKGGSEFIFPSLSSTVRKIGEYLLGAYFWQASLNTLLRVVIAFMLAFMLALITGTLAYIFPTVKKILAPFIHIMISAPTVAFMIILNLVAVKRTMSPVIVSLTVIYPTAYASVSAAFSNIDDKLVVMAKMYKVPLKKRIFSFYVPYVMPYIIEQAGTTASFTLKITVSAEIIAYTYKSLGGMINKANQWIETDGVMALTVISVLFALLIEGVIKAAVYFYKRGKRL